jgi:hypothetical protein
MSKVNNNFAGLNGFIWWMGEIRDTADVLGVGRARVRVFGWYDDIPDVDLPWAQAMYPINAAHTFSAPTEGEWVVGFFLDGESGQYPVMMGVLPGFRQSDQSAYTYTGSTGTVAQQNAAQAGSLVGGAGSVSQTGT